MSIKCPLLPIHFIDISTVVLTEVPTTQINGYTFKGCNTKVDGTGIYINFENDSITNDIVVYAIYETKELQVILQKRNGNKVKNTQISFDEVTIEDGYMVLPDVKGYKYSGYIIDNGELITGNIKLEDFINLDNVQFVYTINGTTPVVIISLLLLLIILVTLRRMLKKDKETKKSYTFRVINE